MILRWGSPNHASYEPQNLSHMVALVSSRSIGPPYGHHYPCQTFGCQAIASIYM